MEEEEEVKLLCGKASMIKAAMLRLCPNEVGHFMKGAYELLYSEICEVILPLKKVFFFLKSWYPVDENQGIGFLV